MADVLLLQSTGSASLNEVRSDGFGIVTTPTPEASTGAMAAASIAMMMVLASRKHYPGKILQAA